MLNGKKKPANEYHTMNKDRACVAFFSVPVYYSLKFEMCAMESVALRFSL